MITASRNELSTLLQNALRGGVISRAEGEQATDYNVDYKISAQQLLRLSMIGLLDWSTLLELLSRVDSEPLYPQQLNQRLTFADASLGPDSKQKHTVFDGRNQSLGAVGALIGDFAVAKSFDYELTVIKVVNILDAELMAEQCLEAANRGFHSVLCWQEPSANAVRVYRAAAMNSANSAELTHEKILKHDGLPEFEADSVIWVLSNTLKSLNGFINQNLRFLTEQIVIENSAQELADHYQASLANGIDVPQHSWDLLYTMANRILVPNSEQSRLGAGD